MPFHFRLTTLLKLRGQTRDGCRQQLVEAQRAEAMVQDRIDELHEELGTLRNSAQAASRPGRIDVDRLLDQGRYEMILRQELTTAQTQLQAIAAEVERRRQALVEADREVRILEKLRGQQAARHDAEENKRERKLLDARATLAYVGREDA